MTLTQTKMSQLTNPELKIPALQPDDHGDLEVIAEDEEALIYAENEKRPEDMNMHSSGLTRRDVELLSMY